MTAYQNLRDHIEQGYTQTAIAYMEMRTGISRNFIQLGVFCTTPGNIPLPLWRYHHARMGYIREK